MEQTTPPAGEMHQQAATLALLEAHRYLEILERYLERGRFAPRLYESSLEALEELWNHAQYLRMSDDNITRRDLWKT